ncbi:MAG: hypothetical protein ACKO6N_25900 [Myxococcota bacterium]
MNSTKCVAFAFVLSSLAFVASAEGAERSAQAPAAERVAPAASARVERPATSEQNVLGGSWIVYEWLTCTHEAQTNGQSLPAAMAFCAGN